MLTTLQDVLTTVAAFVVVLSLVVFVHEFGHFQAARWCKVAIDTFSIGFGKAIAGWRDRHGVHWKIGALPLGGYVKFADDADAVSSRPRERLDDPAAFAEARRKGLFHAQPLGARAFVVAAGPLSNFLFAILAFAVAIMIVGRDPLPEAMPARVGVVHAGTPAEAAGLQPGDLIRVVDGAPIGSFLELQRAIAAAPDRTVVFEVERASQRIHVTATPRAEERRSEDGAAVRVGVLGVSPGVLDEERVRVGPIGALAFGATQSWDIVARTAEYVAAVIARKQSGDQIAGPLGIAVASGQLAKAALSGEETSLGERLGRLALWLLQFAAVLSVAVGIVNLLPIPVLDGGHLLFYAIEALRGGRPLSPVAQEWAYRAGFAVLAGLFLFATWNDISRHILGSQG